ncbi:MAG: hypothetical protein FOGNACKC_03765 [Anaerolineae bacterium]|nr:hypothetical protein [Anaerolineae bacterium]
MSHNNDVQKIFEKMPQALVKDKVNGLNATIQLNLSGEGGGDWQVKFTNGQLNIEPGKSASPDLTLGMPASDYIALTKGEANPMGLFMAGKIKVAGNMTLAMKFQDMFDRNLVQ